MVYLIRHGQTSWNQDRRFQGCGDIPLDDTGITQADSLQRYFEKIAFNAIFTSDLSRAYATALKIASGNPASIIIDNRLREIDVGDWEGRTWSQIAIEYADFLEESKARDYRLPIPGGESMRAFYSRSVAAFFDNIPNCDSEGNVLFVTHGGVIRMILIHVLGLALDHYDTLKIDNASITVLQRANAGSKWEIAAMNSLSHLAMTTQ